MIEEMKMDAGNENLTPRQERVVNFVGIGLGVFFLINLYTFLELFFKIVLPNFGKGTFFHYVRLILILSIAASVIETLRRREKVRLYLGFTALLFAINVFSIWRNWFYH